MNAERIPETVRNIFKCAAESAFYAVANDCEDDITRYPKRAQVEIVLDCDRVQSAAREIRPVEDSKILSEWLKANFYEPRFEKDIERAVREIL